VVGGGSKRYFRKKGCEGISSSFCALLWQQWNLRCNAGAPKV
jgi:hypothetical protein